MSEVYNLYTPDPKLDKVFHLINPDYPWQLNTAYEHFHDQKNMEALASNYGAILKCEGNCSWLRFKTRADGTKAKKDMERFYEVIVPALARAYMTNGEVKASIEEITEPFIMMDEMSK